MVGKRPWQPRSSSGRCCSAPAPPNPASPPTPRSRRRPSPRRRRRRPTGARHHRPRRHRRTPARHRRRPRPPPATTAPPRSRQPHRRRRRQDSRGRYDDFVAAALTDLEAGGRRPIPSSTARRSTRCRAASTPGTPSARAPIPAAAATARRPTTTSTSTPPSTAPRGDFMVYDDAPAAARPAGDELRPVDPRRRARPRVRPRRPGARRRARPRAADDRHRAAGRLLRRRLGGPGRRGEAQGVAFSDADVRTRARRDDHGARPARHRPVRPQAGTARRSTGSARSRPASPRASPAARPCSTIRCRWCRTCSTVVTAATATPPFGYDDGQIVRFIIADLNAYWSPSLAGRWAPAADADGRAGRRRPDAVTATTRRATPRPARCYCAATSQVFFDEHARPSTCTTASATSSSATSSAARGARPPSTPSAARSTGEAARLLATA